MDSLIKHHPAKVSIAASVLVFIFFYLFFLMNKTATGFNSLSADRSTQMTSASVNSVIPLEPDMIYLAGGRVGMGCIDNHINCEADERRHEVSIEPFYIGIFEVTNQQIVPFLNALGTHKRKQDKHPLLEIKSEDRDSHILYQDGAYTVEPGYENYPVIEISWQGAMLFSQWLSEVTGKPYRLPTEAEWEYMARAGTNTQHPWGNTQWNGQANCDGCSGSWDNHSFLQEVGSYTPNAWGIYDVLGNVWEWTCSAYSASYNGAELNCLDIDDDENIVLRGGSWFNDPWDARLSNRAYQQKWHQDYHSGFRIAMSAE